MEKHACEKHIYPVSGWNSYKCSKTAKVERDGKWYCGTHDPVAVKQKREARDLEWSERHDAERLAEQEKQKAKAEIERRAGYHNDTKAHMRLYVENRVSKEVADAAYRLGVKQKLAGVKCNCHKCTGAKP